MSDASPFTPEQRATLHVAVGRKRALMRPARVASFNGWTVGLFGALSVVWGLVAGWSGVVIGAALLAVSWNELRGARRLQALDPQGATLLGWNQLILGGVIALYCVYSIASARMAPDPSMQEMVEMAGIPADLIGGLTTILYGAVLVIVTLVQLLLARYHFRAKAKVEAFRQETPRWIVELLAGPDPSRR